MRLPFLLFALVGCGAPPEPAPPAPASAAEELMPPSPGTSSSGSLAGTQWALRQIDGDPAPADAEATVAFADSTMSGTGGCNRFYGRYTAESAGFAGPVFHVEDLLATEMHCGPLQPFEDRYLGALARARRWLVDGDTLELVGAGPALAFLRGP